MLNVIVDSARFSLKYLMNKGMATANAEQTILLVDKDLVTSTGPPSIWRLKGCESFDVTTERMLSR